MLSVIRVVLRAEKSVLMNPGPTTTLHPRLPRWAVGPELCGTPNTNFPGAQKLVFVGSLWASLQTLLLNQNAGSPMFCIVPRRSGRTVASPVNALLATMRLTGFPPWSCVIVDNCHPSTHRLQLQGGN